MPTRTALDIAHRASSAGTPSPEHKRFQSLLAKTDKARLRLQGWHEQLPLFAQSHQQRAEPAQAPLDVARRASAFKLEQLPLSRKWAGTDRQTLAAVTATQVRNFNNLLAEQPDGLQAEIDARQDAFCASYGLFTKQRPDPLKLSLLLQDKLHTLLAQKSLLTAQQRQLRGDAATAKLRLKRWQQQARLHDAFF